MSPALRASFRDVEGRGPRCTALVYIDDLYRGASEETWDRFLTAMAWARTTHQTAFVTVLAVAEETPEGIDRLVPVKKVMS